MKIRIAFFIFFRFYFVKDRRVLLYAGVGDLLSRWVLLCSSRPWWRYGGGGGEAGEPAAVGGAGGGGVGAGGGGERLRIPSLLPLAQVRSGVQPAAAHHPRRRQRHRGERRHPPGDGLQQVPPVGGPPRRSCLRLLGLRRALPCRQRDRHQRALLAAVAGSGGGHQQQRVAGDGGAGDEHEELPPEQGHRRRHPQGLHRPQRRGLHGDLLGSPPQLRHQAPAGLLAGDSGDLRRPHVPGPALRPRHGGRRLRARPLPLRADRQRPPGPLPPHHHGPGRPPRHPRLGLLHLRGGHGGVPPRPARRPPEDDALPGPRQEEEHRRRLRRPVQLVGAAGRFRGGPGQVRAAAAAGVDVGGEPRELHGGGGGFFRREHPARRGRGSGAEEEAEAPAGGGLRVPGGPGEGGFLAPVLRLLPRRRLRGHGAQQPGADRSRRRRGGHHHPPLPLQLLQLPRPPPRRGHLRALCQMEDAAEAGVDGGDAGADGGGARALRLRLQGDALRLHRHPRHLLRVPVLGDDPHRLRALRPEALRRHLQLHDPRQPPRGAALLRLPRRLRLRPGGRQARRRRQRLRRDLPRRRVLQAHLRGPGRRLHAGLRPEHHPHPQDQARLPHALLRRLIPDAPELAAAALSHSWPERAELQALLLLLSVDESKGRAWGS